MILVTGASGFLGQHLLTELSKGQEPVRALYFHQKDLPEFPNVTWHQCDLLDVVAIENMIKGVDKVYNCAATVSYHPKDRIKLTKHNITIVANVVNAALAENVQKVIHVSSTAALGQSQEKKDNKTINEQTPFHHEEQHSRYAYGKYYAELEVWRGMAEGLNAAIVNPGIILGVGDWSKGSARLMKVVADEFSWFTEGQTAWVAAADVTKAMILLMESSISEERYILSNGNFTFKDMFTRMAMALGKKPPHRKAGKWQSGIVWRLSLLKSKLTGHLNTITRETAHNAQQINVFDNSKFLKAVPNFQYTPIEETLLTMAKDYKQKENTDK